MASAKRSPPERSGRVRRGRVERGSDGIDRRTDMLNIKVVTRRLRGARTLAKRTTRSG